jgi:hypothetical protein
MPMNPNADPVCPFDVVCDSTGEIFTVETYVLAKNFDDNADKWQKELSEEAFLDKMMENFYARFSTGDHILMDVFNSVYSPLTETAPEYDAARKRLEAAGIELYEKVRAYNDADNALQYAEDEYDAAHAAFTVVKNESR